MGIYVYIWVYMGIYIYICGCIWVCGQRRSTLEPRISLYKGMYVHVYIYIYIYEYGCVASARIPSSLRLAYTKICMCMYIYMSIGMWPAPEYPRASD